MNLDGVTWRKLAYWGSRWCPRWWLRLAPGPIGWLLGRLLGTRRRQIEAVLRWTTGSSELTDELFRNFAHCLAESLAAGRAERCDVRVLGGEHLQELLAVARSETEAALGSGEGPGSEAPGVVLVTAHTGAWEVVAAALAERHSIPLHLLIRPERDLRASALHAELRAERGVGTLASDGAAESALQAFNRLQSGGWLALQMDRPAPSRRALSVELFGRPFELPRGPFHLARQAGAYIVPVFNARVGFLKYEVEMFRPVRLPPTAGEAELKDAAVYSVQCFERFVRRYPAQWFHFSEPPPAA
jgi:KDO2-lipid IV(A) lauroyltransferase